MRSEKIINFGQFCNKKCIIFLFPFNKSWLHVSDKFWCEHISLLLWSAGTRFIKLIWFRSRFVHFSPWIVTQTHSRDTEQIPIFQQLDLLGGKIWFGWLSCHPRRPFNNARDTISTLQIQARIQTQNTKYGYTHKYLFGWVSAVTQGERSTM